MTSVLSNFLTIRRTRGDVLDPVSFRTAVDMIRGIMKKYNYAELTTDYQSFLAHIINYNDPHHDLNTDFLPEILTRIYNIYQVMTATPLSQADFEAQIVPTLGFFELLRRMYLNHILYTKIKKLDGSVPASVSLTLTSDWGWDPNLPSPVTVSFGAALANETAFIQSGWGFHTTPINPVFSADNLTQVNDNLITLFETSSTTPYLFTSGSEGNYQIPLLLESNDCVIDLQVVNAPASFVQLLSLTNGTDLLTVSMNPDRSVSVAWNNTILTSPTIVCYNGYIRITVSSSGELSLQTSQNGVYLRNIYNITFQNQAAFTSAHLGVAHENLVTPTFGLRHLAILRGYLYEDLAYDYVLPDGYTYLQDPDGAILVDVDGVPLIEPI